MAKNHRFLPLIRLLPILLLPLACTPHVQPVSKQTLARLSQNSVPSLPAELHQGEWLTDLPPLKLPPGSEVRIPLHTTRNLPSIELLINGTPLHWFLDTGAAFPVVLDADSAASIPIPILQRSKLRGLGVGGQTDGLLGRFESLSLADYYPVVGRGIAGILLNQYQLRFVGLPVERMPINLLGLPFLERFSYVILDTSNNEARFGVQRPFHPPKDAASFPFEQRAGRLWVKIQVSGKTIPAFFDTGYAANLRAPSPTILTLPPHSHSSFQNSRQTQKQLGVSGVELDHVGRLHKITLGDVQIDDVEYHASDSCREAILGWGPFRPHRVTLDFQRKRVWVEKAAP